jgi:hypothetical protein
MDLVNNLLLEVVKVNRLLRVILVNNLLMVLLVNNRVLVSLVKVIHVKLDKTREVNLVLVKDKIKEGQVVTVKDKIKVVRVVTVKDKIKVVRVVTVKDKIKVVRVKEAKKVDQTKTDLIKVKVVPKMKIKIRTQGVLQIPRGVNNQINKIRTHNKVEGVSLPRQTECFNKRLL